MKTTFTQLYEQLFLKRKPDSLFLEYFDTNFQLFQLTIMDFHNLVKKHIEDIQSLNASVIILPGNNTPNYLAKITATLLANKVAFPINPDYPNEFLINLVSKYKLDATIIREDSIINCENLTSKSQDHTKDFIYILTSGTTGTSKIVRQPIQAVTSNVDSLIKAHSLDKQRKILTPLPCFHVNALEFSFLGCLLSCSQLVLLENSSPDTILKAISKTNPDIVSIEPNLLRALTIWHEHNNKIVKFKDFYFVTAASALSQDLYVKSREIFRKKVLQGYGLSEAMNFSTLIPPTLDVKEIDQLMTVNDRTCIGPALAPGCVEVIDGNNKLLKEREIGEIKLKGQFLMTGYLGFNSLCEDNTDYFLTGDLGYYISYQGAPYFFISGRKKEIIKRNSINIPLIEIDEIVHPLLFEKEDAISVGFKSETKGEDLALVFYNLLDENRLKEIQDQIINHLPDFQKPAVYIRSSYTLRTASGKPKRLFFSEKLNYLEQSLFPNNGTIIKDSL